MFCCATEQLLWHGQGTQLAPLEQHPPDQVPVTLSLTDDVFQYSSTQARWQLGVPLPVD
jgi:hypothetical protein